MRVIKYINKYIEGSLYPKKPKKAKYIYCFVSLKKAHRFFGLIGLHDEQVYTINYKDLACVLSDVKMTEYTIADTDHLKAHEMVLETIIKRYETLLPVRFGTVAVNAVAVKRFLRRNYRTLKPLFKKLESKVEIEIEIFWKEIKQIFAKIVHKSKRLRTLKASKKRKTRKELILTGQLVERP